MEWLWVFVLGGLGAVCRVAISGWLPHRALPWGTLTVNLLGCVAIGIAFHLVESRAWSSELRLAAVGGFLGGFTTFSAFGLECWRLVADGSPGLAGAYALASVGLGVLGAWGGWMLARGFA